MGESSSSIASISAHASSSAGAPCARAITGTPLGRAMPAKEALDIVIIRRPRRLGLKAEEGDFLLGTAQRMVLDRPSR